MKQNIIYQSSTGTEKTVIDLLSNGRVRKTVYLSEVGGKTYNQKVIRFMSSLCKYLIKNPNQMIVPVYEFYPQINGYFYTMEKLQPLTELEKNYIITLTCEGHRYNTSGACVGRVFSTEEEQAIDRAVRMRYPNLVSFMQALEVSDRYGDLHSGNIMKDGQGNWRLIDLESYLILPIDHPENDWFRGNK